MALRTAGYTSPEQVRGGAADARRRAGLVKMQWDSLYVRLLDPKTGQLLREHVGQKGGWYRIKDEDRTKRTRLKTSQLLWRAGRAGTNIG